jgi:hypothetical protein
LIVSLLHLPADATVDDAIAELDRSGGVIIDDAMSPGLLHRVRIELAPYIEHTSDGIDEFVGQKTRRIGALLGRSQACGDLVVDPLVNSVAEKFLSPYCDRHQLNLTQGVSIGPGEKGQVLHRDRTLWGGFIPFNLETHLSTMWAVSEFTAANGATRIVPGSHRWDEDRVPEAQEVVAAEMRAGSVLLYTGKVIHGGGPNSTDERRLGVIIHYILGWLRQEENQYLSCPPEIAARLSPELRSIAGYSKGRYSLGFFSSPGAPGEGHELASPEELFGEEARSFEKKAGLGVDAS